MLVMMKKKQLKPGDRVPRYSWGPQILKPLIAQRGLSQAGVARQLAALDKQRNALHLSADQDRAHTKQFEDRVYKWTKGDVEHPRGPIMADLCRILSVEPGFFENVPAPGNPNLTMSRETPSRRSDFTLAAPIAISHASIPIRGRSMAGKEGALIFSSGDVVGRVDAPSDISVVPDAYAVYVTGDSMTPVYRPGHILIVNPYMPPNPHDDVVIQVTKDNGATIEGYVKRFLSMDEKHVKVCQFNPEQTLRFPRDQVVAIHTVIYGKRR